MKQKKTVGSVNACNVLHLKDAKGNTIGHCADTPNAFAVACIVIESVVSGVSCYQFFGNTQRNRTDADTLERVNMFRGCVANGFCDDFDKLRQTIVIY